MTSIPAAVDAFSNDGMRRLSSRCSLLSLSAFLSLVALTSPSKAVGPYTWDFTGGSTPLSGPATTPRSFASGGGVVNVYGYSNTGTGGSLQRSYVGDYQYGLGVTNSSDSSHTVDNFGHIDLLVLQFAQPMIAKSLTLKAFGDTDVEIWTGNVAAGFDFTGKSIGYLGTVLTDHGIFAGGYTDRTVSFANFLPGNILIVSAAPGQYDDSFKISAVTAVPGPIAGAGLPALFGLAGSWLVRRRKQRLAA